ncbi:uncharacterized protein BJ212DRAFT_757807 [Suillus subaureus]|uniref:Uncharacterized protein n=1 Tax=Suillus subaureus TaxID=48587 RepID=A0A9P7E072_9AGAM|nr:uncharacterized protein BJ212DRAFT_757807 [Suillus subaureus]KAG1807301.1 hypothetical protein BJ212DRAFT_757807 [Suillus subaureus]
MMLVLLRLLHHAVLLCICLLSTVLSPLSWRLLLHFTALLVFEMEASIRLTNRNFGDTTDSSLLQVRSGLFTSEIGDIRVDVFTFGTSTRGFRTTIGPIIDGRKGLVRNRAIALHRWFVEVQPHLKVTISPASGLTLARTVLDLRTDFFTRRQFRTVLLRVKTRCVYLRRRTKDKIVLILCLLSCYCKHNSRPKGSPCNRISSISSSFVRRPLVPVVRSSHH